MVSQVMFFILLMPANAYVDHVWHAPFVPGSIVALYSSTHNRFVAMNNANVQPSEVIAKDDIPTSWTWERFSVVDAGQGDFALYNTNLDLYIRMNEDGTVDAIQSEVGEWSGTRFHVTTVSVNGPFSLWNPHTKRYLRMTDVNGTTVVDGSAVSDDNVLDSQISFEVVLLEEVEPALVTMAYHGKGTCSNSNSEISNFAPTTAAECEGFCRRNAACHFASHEASGYCALFRTCDSLIDVAPNQFTTSIKVGISYTFEDLITTAGSYDAHLDSSCGTVSDCNVWYNGDVDYDGEEASCFNFCHSNSVRDGCPQTTCVAAVHFVDYGCKLVHGTCTVENTVDAQGLTLLTPKGVWRADVCDLQGVTCVNGEPETVDWSGLLTQPATMDFPNYGGALPSVILGLKQFAIANNNIVGDLPTLQSNVDSAAINLEVLDISGNNITGTLPSSYQAFENMVDFKAYDNLLNGTLPHSYKHWTDVERFDVHNNQLTGSIPADYPLNWDDVIIFRADTNQLSGTIPGEFNFSRQSIQEFRVSDNHLTGTLPEEFELCGLMKRFNVGHNSLSGTLPPAYGSMTNLISFDVSANFLNGSVPAEYGSWWNLNQLDISHNQLTGRLPAELSSFQSMVKFEAVGNDLGDIIDPKLLECWTKVAEHKVSIDGALDMPVGKLPQSEDYCRATTLALPAAADICSKLAVRTRQKDVVDGHDMCHIVPTAECESMYVRRVVDAHVMLCELHTSVDGAQSCVDGQAQECISEYISALVEHQATLGDSCSGSHSQILEAQRTLDGLVQQATQLTESKTIEENNIDGWNTTLNEILADQERYLVEKKADYALCNATAQHERNTDLRALWEELKELEMIARPHRSAVPTHLATVDMVSNYQPGPHDGEESLRSAVSTTEDYAQVEKDFATQARADAANQEWTHDLRSNVVQSMGYHDSNPNREDASTSLVENATSLVETQTETQQVESMFLEIQSEARALTGQGAFMLSTETVQMGAASFLEQISTMNLTLDSRACSMMNRVLDRVHTKYGASSEPEVRSCDTARASLQTEFTSAYNLIAGLYDNESIAIENKYENCTYYAHLDYVRKMEATIVQILNVTRNVRTAEHTITLLIPRINDVNRAIALAEAHLITLKGYCQVADEASVGLELIRKLIIELETCPGGNTFTLDMPDWTPPEGWWWNLTERSAGGHPIAEGSLLGMDTWYE